MNTNISCKRDTVTIEKIVRKATFLTQGLNLSVILEKFRSEGLQAELARGASIAFLIQTIGTGFGYFTQILLARWMGTTNYGTFIYALTWAQVLTIIATFGLDAGVVRFIPQYLVQEATDRLCGIIIWSRRWVFIFGLLVAGLSYTIVIIFQPFKQDLNTTALGLWLIPLLGLLEIQTQVLRSMGHIALAYAPSILFQPFIVLVIAFFIIIVGGILTGTDAILITALALIIILSIQLLGIRTILLARVEHNRPLFLTREWLQVSIPLLFTSIFFTMISRMDVLILGLFIGSNDVGIYSAAVKTANLVNFTLAAVYAVIAPVIVSYHTKQDMTGLQEIVRFSTFWTFCFSIAISGALFIFSRSILDAFGRDFIQAKPALFILIVGQLVNVGTGPVGLLVNLTGYEKNGALILGWSALINVGLCLIAIPLLGITGAAWASTATMVVWNIWLDRLVTKRLGINASIIYAVRMIFFSKPSDKGMEL